MEEVYHFSKAFLCLILTGNICKSNPCLFLDIYFGITLSYAAHHTAALADSTHNEIHHSIDQHKRKYITNHNRKNRIRSTAVLLFIRADLILIFCFF